MNIPYIIFALMMSLSSYGQEFTQKQLKKTEWFSDNKDSIFFKTDTIKLIKYIQKSQQQFNKHQIQYDVSEHEHLGHLEYVKLGFKKGGNFNFDQINWSQGISYARGILFWKYDENSLTIYIYEDKKTKFKFKIIDLREINLASKKNKNETIKSTELTLLRLY